MFNWIEFSRTRWAIARRAVNQLQTGGDWALQFPAAVQSNLRYFFFDGFFASASDNIWGTYLVVYFLSLGATQAQIGLMSSISSLAAAAILMPGALLVERIGRRKEITLISGAIGARLTILVLAALPFLIGGPALPIICIAVAITHDVLGNVAYPAWMSLTGEIVPMEGRGRYFSSRNIAMSGAGIAVTFVAGLVLSRVGQPIGYQGAMLFAFLIAMCSTYSFSRIQDPGMTIPAREKAVDAQGNNRRVWVALRENLDDLRTHPQFMVLLFTTAFWNFSLNVAGPFFTVYQVKNLGSDAAMIALTSIASTAAALFSQRIWGQLNDRWGARRLQMICGLAIPVVPLLWVFVRAPWHIIPLNIISGILWSGYNLASFNYLLALTPPAQRARYSAVFQITVTLALAIGAATGSLIVTSFGYIAIFVGSSVGRLIAALLFARMAKEEKPVASLLSS